MRPLAPLRALSLTCALTALAACSSAESPPSGGTDALPGDAAPSLDAAPLDAGAVTLDASARPDAGADDARTNLDASEPTDAAAPDAAAPDAAAPLPCGGAALCDDFEGAPTGGAPDPAIWTVATPNCSGTGRVTIDGTVAHGGARSVRVDGQGGYCNHVFIAAPLRPGGAIHGRFWLRLDAALGDGHVTIAAFRDANDTGKDLRFGGQSRIFMWNRESDDATLPVLSPAGIAMSVAPSPATWHCIELDVDVAGALTTKVDGTLVPGLVIDGAPTPDVDQQWLARGAWTPSLQDVRIGWESYAGQALTLWIDDVAFGEVAPGCE